MYNTPRDTRSHLPMHPPIAEQDIPDSAAQTHTTFYQTQHQPQPLSDVLAGNMEYPSRSNPTHCQYVSRFTPQYFPQSNQDRMATVALQPVFETMDALLVTILPRNQTHHILCKDTCLDMDQSPRSLESMKQ